MADRTDEQLILEVQNGDIFAFELLVKRYQKRLFTFVLHMSGDSELAQDVVQEAFISLYKTIDRVDTKRKFSSYIFAITRNEAFSALRKYKKETVLDEEVTSDEEELLYERMAQAEQAHTISRALAKISSGYRRIIQLYYFDDLSYEQISKKLSLPINTVRTHLRRAKGVLKKILIYETH